MEFLLMDDGYWDEEEEHVEAEEVPAKKAQKAAKAPVVSVASTESSRGSIKPSGVAGAVLGTGSIMVGLGLRFFGAGLVIWGGLSAFRWLLKGAMNAGESTLGSLGSSGALAA